MRFSLTIIVVFVIFTNCSVYLKHPSIGNNAQWKTVTYNDSAVFCLPKSKHRIDSVINTRSGRTYLVNNNCFKLPACDLKAGINELSLLFYLSNSKIRKKKERLYMVSEIIPKQIPVKNYNLIKHDESAYTQGLIYWNDLLYESTGLRGESTIRTINPKNGDVLTKQLLTDSVFGEGMTLFNSELYVLTWKDSLVLKFNTDLQLIEQNTYRKEGWGLTNIDRRLLASDGSDYLFYLDSNNYQIDSVFQVFNHRGPVYYLNELEYIDNHIWANVLGKDTIMVIDPENGKVEMEIDVTNCIDRLQHPDAGALNGIAYDKVNQVVYLTGKNWPFMLIWRPFFFEK